MACGLGPVVRRAFPPATGHLPWQGLGEPTELHLCAEKEVFVLRIAVISDIHSNLVAWKQLSPTQRPLPGRHCLPAICHEGSAARECIELFRSLEPIHIVRGNYDHMFTRFPPGLGAQNKESVIAEDLSITGRPSPNPTGVARQPTDLGHAHCRRHSI